MSIALTPQQRRIVTVIWGTYAFYYLGRLNISPALPALQNSLGVGRVEIGWLGTVFFWVYTLGQVVNGELGNHLKPRYIVALGLLLVALTNILFSMQTALWMMLILWGINGFAQATGWAPMMRILSDRLNDKQRQRISTYFPMSFQVGNGLTWAAAGLMVAWGGWQMAFWLPGVIMLGVLAVWWFSDTETLLQKSDQKNMFSFRDMGQEWRHLSWSLLVAAAIGFIHTGMAIWLPTYVSDLKLFPEAMIGSIAGFMAIIGIVGMWFSGQLLTHFHGLRWVMSIITSGLALILIAGAFFPVWPQLFMMACAVMTSSGLAGLLVGTAPMLLAREGRVSSASGVLTAVFGLGGGFAGVMVGVVLEISNWSMVFLLWAGCALLALLLMQRIQQTNEVAT